MGIKLGLIVQDPSVVGKSPQQQPTIESAALGRFPALGINTNEVIVMIATARKAVQRNYTKT